MIKYENEPLEIKTDVPNGNYDVTLDITAHSDTVYTVYSQNRRFIAEDVEIRAGEKHEIKFIANVCDYVRRDSAHVVNGVEIYIACDGDITVMSAVSPVNVPTLWIIGDSTVTDQPSEYPYDPEKTYCGWGQVMPMLLDNEIAVSNHAESGATSAETRAIHFTAIKDKIQKGDYLMMEFGHNDQKLEELDAFGGYAEQLRYFVNYARERGAIPIVNSPINRIIFGSDGKIFNLLGEYRDAAKAVAEEFSAPFIDMWTATTEVFEPLGLYTAKKYFRHDGESQDYTHTNDLGGGIVARLCAGLIANAEIDGLSERVRVERLEIEEIEPDPDAPFETNAQEFERLKTLGMVDVPADIYDDISHI